MSLFRGFIAVDIPVSPKLSALIQGIQQSGAKVKLVEPENIHITLKFLGDVDESLVEDLASIMTKACQGIEPFSITLKGTGVFPNPQYIKIIWVGIENSENLGIIAHRIDEETAHLGFTREKRGFKAHLTIGRVKSAVHKERLIQIIENYCAVEFGEVPIDTLKLKKSDLRPEGPIYTEIKTIQLDE